MTRGWVWSHRRNATASGRGVPQLAVVRHVLHRQARIGPARAVPHADRQGVRIAAEDFRDVGVLDEAPAKARRRLDALSLPQEQKRHLEAIRRISPRPPPPSGRTNAPCRPGPRADIPIRSPGGPPGGRPGSTPAFSPSSICPRRRRPSRSWHRATPCAARRNGRFSRCRHSMNSSNPSGSTLAPSEYPRS